MKQVNELGSRRTSVKTADVWSLVPVTVKASQGEVAENSSPAMMPSNDVVDFK
jgi:hypothetical protein